MVMFDLPVMTDSERKAASHFRKQLLDDGYLMIQFSVYARPCVSQETLQKHSIALQKIIPAAGNIRVMFITDQQWGRSYTVTGPNYKQGKHALDPQMPQQIEFWE